MCAPIDKYTRATANYRPHTQVDSNVMRLNANNNTAGLEESSNHRGPSNTDTTETGIRFIY